MGVLRQALLVATTAVVVAFIIPAYRKPSLPVPEIFGTVAPGFEEVRETFRKNYEDGWDVSEGGSAFSVYKDGEKVVDLWAGYADYEARRLWREDTMSMIFSTSKAIGALCVAMLADRRLVDFKKPVAEYWPEFGQNGKAKITVEQLLEHEAGLFVIKRPLSFDLLRDHESMDEVIIESEPLWEPGTRHGYHAFTLGPLVDGLVRRVDPKKRTIGQFFDDEVRKPFDIDIYLGAPVEIDHRIGRLIFVKETLSHFWYAIRNIDVVRQSVLDYIFGNDKNIQSVFENCGEVCESYRMADPEIRKIELASANAMATARGLAKLFGILANGGKAGNKTLLSKEVIDEYANDRRGLTPDAVTWGQLIRWKYGMHVLPQPNDGANLFGSPGHGGQAGYADPDNRLSYGFISRYLSPIGLDFSDPRLGNLRDSVLRSLNLQNENL